jgi:hypothetical protein
METFAIQPASTKPLWFFGIIFVVLIAILAVMIWSAWSSRHSRAEFTPDGLRLVGDLWGRTIPWSDIQPAGARVLDLEHDRDHRPRWRTMGTGLPGYSAGWFRLRNGEKALVYLTDRSRVVYVPTTRGHSILLSVTEPDRFLQALVQQTGEG